MAEIIFSTYNIRNTTDRYEERRILLETLLKTRKYDIIGLQEVRFLSSSFNDFSLQITSNTSNSITNSMSTEQFIDQTIELISNHYFIVKTTLKEPFLKQNDPTFRIDGNCICFLKEKFDLISSKDLILSSCRNAQRITLKIKEINVIFSFTNVHLHHLLESIDAEIRLDQIQRTIGWINELDEAESIPYSILVGDFNCSPNEVGYPFILSEGFLSCYKEYHGSEPTQTFPTGLQATTMDTDGPIACDYIFFRQNKWNSLSQSNSTRFNIISSSLFGNEPSPDDPTLYPSDHIGVEAVISFISEE